jgi:hypothetical protein
MLVLGVFLIGAALGALVGVMVYSRQISAAPGGSSASHGQTWLTRLDDRFSSTRLHIRLNLWGVGIWLVLLVPTVLIWRDSVAYVVFMSWYANFVGHISAYIAAKAEEVVENGNGGEAPAGSG